MTTYKYKVEGREFVTVPVPVTDGDHMVIDGQLYVMENEVLKLVGKANFITQAES